MNYLTTKNLTPELKINPKVGGRREFFLYQTFQDGKPEQIIYSNSEVLHPNAVKGQFSEEIYEELEEKLLL